MKKIIHLSLLLLTVALLMYACKSKDKPQTTIEKIRGKWTLESETDNEHTSGQDNITHVAGTATDIIDFRNDGKVYSDVQGSKDTSAYTMSGDTKIVFDGIETFDIKTLSPNAFIIYSKELIGTDDYEEITLSLKR